MTLRTVGEGQMCLSVPNSLGPNCSKKTGRFWGAVKFFDSVVLMLLLLLLMAC